MPDAVDRPYEGDAVPELRPTYGTDGPNVKLPDGVSGGDDQSTLESCDPADIHFGELEDELDPFADQAEAGEEVLPSGERAFEHTPDGLDEGAAERAELAAWLAKLADADDRVFTAGERADIEREVQALRAEVRRLTELNRHQQEVLDRLLAEVQRGSERMGRKDWVMYAIGTATSLVIMEIVPPLVLWPLAVHAIRALGHLLLLDA